MRMMTLTLKTHQMMILTRLRLMMSQRRVTAAVTQV